MNISSYPEVISSSADNFVGSPGLSVLHSAFLTRSPTIFLINLDEFMRYLNLILDTK